MATISEFFGHKVEQNPAEAPGEAVANRQRYLASQCPFINDVCDVSSNRSDLAFFNLLHNSVSDRDREEFALHYGEARIPSGVCSLSVKRQNEAVPRPWIVCPRRLLDLKIGAARLPPELRALIPLPDGTPIHVWWEVKFRDRNPGGLDFFEYTFDYLLMPYEADAAGNFIRYVGPPFNIEIMTSSTRGGGLTEHMTDILLGRPQRRLTGGMVKSPYTPNYRQVFGRMTSQIFAKSEILEVWGGRSFWLVQDVLVDYIKQTTAFRPENFRDSEAGNLFLMVYTMEDRGDRYDVQFVETLRGQARPAETEIPDFTPMLGIGHAPTFQSIQNMLTTSLQSGRAENERNWSSIIL